jgi:hypothetical protein
VPKSKSRQKNRKQRSYVPTPEQKKPRSSPRWYGATVIGLIFVGVAVIVVNYVGLMPGTGRTFDPIYLWVGLGLILVGFMGTMRLR